MNRDGGTFDLPPGVERDPVVYEVFDLNGACLYVGMTENLLVRLGQHFNARRGSLWARSAAQVRFTFCDTRSEAARLEADLITERQPAHNVALRGRIAP